MRSDRRVPWPYVLVFMFWAFGAGVALTLGVLTIQNEREAEREFCAAWAAREWRDDFKRWAEISGYDCEMKP